MITLLERYRDVASDLWPVSVTPQPGELLSSWLHRLAFANGVAPRGFARVLGAGQGMWSPRLDLRLHVDVARLLSHHTGISEQQLLSMTLPDDETRRLLLPLRNTGRREAATWLQFCSRCLAADEQPYFRRNWRLSTHISCPIHRQGLRDSCPSCHRRIMAFAQTALVAQHICLGCAYDFRGASKVPVSLHARAFERCTHDLLKQAGSVNKLDRVYDALFSKLPTVSARRRPLMTLGPMSVATRIRLFERLASQGAIDQATDVEGVAYDCYCAVLKVRLDSRGTGDHRPKIRY